MRALSCRRGPSTPWVMRAGFNRLQVRPRQSSRAFEVEANWNPGPSLTSSQHRHIRFQLTLSLLCRSLLFCFVLSFFNTDLCTCPEENHSALKVWWNNFSMLFVFTSEWLSLMSRWMPCNHDARIILQKDFDCLTAWCVWVCAHFFTSHLSSMNLLESQCQVKHPENTESSALWHPDLYVMKSWISSLSYLSFHQNTSYLCHC